MMTQRNKHPQFAICIQNKDGEDLSLRKIHQVLPDETASKDDHLRVIDDSGDDYLYPANFFVRIQLSPEVEQALLVIA